MKPRDFKKIVGLLTEVYAKVKEESLEAGIDIFSEEYDQLIALAREKVLANFGFTVAQYREAKAKASKFSQVDMLEVAEDVKESVKQYNDTHIPTRQEIEEIAREVAQEFVVAPIIKHEIVKETTVEKPRIIETVRNVTVKETYNDKPLKKEIARVEGKVDAIKIPEIDTSKFFFRDEFSEYFEHNIDTLGMPDFRKLSMGLQQQIDEKVTGVNTHKITVSTSAPSNPQLYDLWVDIS
jgi:beta-glucosidase-like glycosyl hydrolase